MALPMISVSLCTHNRRDLLEQTLLSLENQLTDGLFTYEVIVIDDGSTDGTGTFITEYRTRTPLSMRYVYLEGVGVAGARNRGVTEAHGEWIAFIDDDETAEPDWLLRLATVAFPANADCVGAPILAQSPAGSPITPVGAVTKLLGENPAMKSDSGSSLINDKSFLYNLPSTGNALVKRSLFDTVGLFNPALSVGEDMDFFKRARKAGCTILRAPDAVVHHTVPLHRLRAEYLIPLAAKSGMTQAYFDRKEWGLGRNVLSAFLRLLHAVFWTLPMLAFSYLRGDKDWFMSRRCSLGFAATYVSKTWSMLFTQHNLSHK